MRTLNDLLAITCLLAGIYPDPCSSGTEQNSASAGKDLPQHWTPEEIWRGVDVEKLPLEVQVIKRWEEDGCAYQKLTYLSEVAEGVKIRVFGMLGVPNGAKPFPGILHIHGRGQTASLAWVQYWARRGYACLTYDLCGRWENRTEYTDWGPLAKNCCMASNGVYQVHPTPRVCGWSHWALAGRRALTLQAQTPAVDRAMMVAMMLPSASPTFLNTRRAPVSLPVMAAGYFSVWLAAGAGIYALGVLFAAAAMRGIP